MPHRRAATGRLPGFLLHVGLLLVAGPLAAELGARPALALAQTPAAAQVRAVSVPAGAWEAPLAGPLAVTRPFTPPASRYGPGHRGVDLAGPAGAVVRAAGGGTVSFAGPLAGRGVVVVVHGLLRTTYEPVVAAVRVGAPVARGTPLGTLEPGHPGCPVPACLHWGLLRGDTYLDPLLLLAGPVRLVPWIEEVAGRAGIGTAEAAPAGAAAGMVEPAGDGPPGAAPGVVEPAGDRPPGRTSGSGASGGAVSGSTRRSAEPPAAIGWPAALAATGGVGALAAIGLRRRRRG